MQRRALSAGVVALALAGLVLGAAQAGPGAKGGKAVNAKPGVSKKPFGKTPDGKEVDLYVLTNARGMTAKVITYGGIVTELTAPDKAGKFENVVLGFDNLKDYLAGHPYFGAITGRVANRIAGAKFTLDGTEYKLAANDGPNTLHGGKKGLDKVVWKAEPIEASAAVGLKLTYLSPDGEQGFPGNLSLTVTYHLTNDNELKIDYSAKTDKATPLNLTHHGYYNLATPKAGDVLGHELMIAADEYTPADDKLLPTGKIEPVKGTPLDFTKPTAIGARIEQLKNKPLGYDHNYVLRGGGKSLVLAARVHEPKTGRVLEVSTTEPGLQFYSGNFLSGKEKGHGGVVYRQHQGFCLEAQHFPDSVHHANFPSTILRPGETYKQTTVYKFSAK
jgi:aldose 1-epimerase